jgi:hypothetical protein
MVWAVRAVGNTCAELEAQLAVRVQSNSCRLHAVLISTLAGHVIWKGFGSQCVNQPVGLARLTEPGEYLPELAAT